MCWYSHYAFTIYTPHQGSIINIRMSYLHYHNSAWERIKIVEMQLHNHNLGLSTTQSPYVIDVKVLRPEKEIYVFCTSCYLRVRWANFVGASNLGVWNGLRSQTSHAPRRCVVVATMTGSFEIYDRICVLCVRFITSPLYIYCNNLTSVNLIYAPT